VLALALPATALAAGYDTPMLYSARHMGMGGTANSYVADPSAPFHNPAGLARVQGGAIMLNGSPLFGTIKASPHADAKSIDTKPTVAPLFLAGAAYRVLPDLVAGLSVYPAGSAAGAYEYPGANGKTVTDSATLAFIEVAPTLAYALPMGFKAGATFRYTMATFKRQRTDGSPIDLDMSGSDAKGYRLGLQWAGGQFDVGASYRSRIDLGVRAATGKLAGLDAEDVTFLFIYPSKLVLGAQYRGLEKLRIAADVEYGFNSENDTTELRGKLTETKTTFPVTNYYRWENGITVRLGCAYRAGDVEVRAGYAHDTQVTQKKYPSAFGTPPTATHIVTAGAAYKISDALDVSLAGAYRTGKATVEKADLDPQCVFCGKEGDYGINLFGAYVDLVWRFGEQKLAPAPEEGRDGGGQSRPGG
jgi:long-subunit fatty acid transport protein